MGGGPFYRRVLQKEPGGIQKIGGGKLRGKRTRNIQREYKERNTYKRGKGKIYFASRMGKKSE